VILQIELKRTLLQGWVGEKSIFDRDVSDWKCVHVPNGPEIAALAGTHHRNIGGPFKQPSHMKPNRRWMLIHLLGGPVVMGDTHTIWEAHQFMGLHGYRYLRRLVLQNKHHVLSIPIKGVELMLPNPDYKTLLSA